VGTPNIFQCARSRRDAVKLSKLLIRAAATTAASAAFVQIIVLLWVGLQCPLLEGL
jgi:hypothetical protein